MAEHLFTYGTLRRGFNNPYSAMVRARGQFVRETTVPGTIYQLEGYPGFVPAAGTNPVRGDLYSIPESLLEDLDDYEGPAYKRVRIMTACGVEAWIYQYTASVAGRQVIASGDFAKP